MKKNRCCCCCYYYCSFRCCLLIYIWITEDMYTNIPMCVCVTTYQMMIIGICFVFFFCCSGNAILCIFFLAFWFFFWMIIIWPECFFSLLLPLVLLSSETESFPWKPFFSIFFETFSSNQNKKGTNYCFSFIQKHMHRTPARKIFSIFIITFWFFNEKN